jgi:hypothetical protein
VEPGERVLSGMALRQELEVSVAEGAVDCGQIGPRHRSDLFDAALDVALDLIRQLLAPRTEDLDAVVLGRVVGC